VPVVKRPACGAATHQLVPRLGILGSIHPLRHTYKENLSFYFMCVVLILRVLENRALRRIFGPKRDEVMGYRRKLHNEELLNLYFSPNIFRIMK
jgi:hypothetical protein